MNLALERTKCFFIPPVQANIRRGLLLSLTHQQKFAADSANTLVGEVSYKLPNGVAIEHLPHISKYDDLSSGSSHGTVQCASLSSVLPGMNHLDALSSIFPNQEFRSIRRAVKRNDDLQLALWISERKTVPKLLLDS